MKEPAVVTRKDFNPAGMSADEIERLKLEDGIRLHESVKVELETYARESGNPIVKPFLLVIARDTTHASQLLTQIQSDGFFDGRYKDKVIQVDSSKTGAEEMIARLLKVEQTDKRTEIVIHVNMLKEGWDVTNLYTIVPLRAANARILIEQSIGRGLRLPYGKRTGVTAVDRLNIVTHDKFQEISDEANRPDSAIRLASVVLDDTQFGPKLGTVVAQSHLATKLGFQPTQVTSNTTVAGQNEQPAFTKPAEQHVWPSSPIRSSAAWRTSPRNCLSSSTRSDQRSRRRLSRPLRRKAPRRSLGWKGLLLSCASLSHPVGVTMGVTRFCKWVKISAGKG